MFMSVKYFSFACVSSNRLHNSKLYPRSSRSDLLGFCSLSSHSVLLDSIAGVHRLFLAHAKASRWLREVGFETGKYQVEPDSFWTGRKSCIVMLAGVHGS